jgi:hypothetical protein
VKEEKMNRTSVICFIIFLVLGLSGCTGSSPKSTEAIPTQDVELPLVEATNSTIDMETKQPSQSSTPTFTQTTTIRFGSNKPIVEVTSENCPDPMSTVCVPGLYISFFQPIPVKYEVSVLWPGFTGKSFSCPQVMTLVTFGDNMAPVECDENGINFISVGLSEFTISIESEGLMTTSTLYPEYRIHAPAGENCNPQCSIGEVEMPIDWIATH